MPGVPGNVDENGATPHHVIWKPETSRGQALKWAEVIIRPSSDIDEDSLKPSESSQSHSLSMSKDSAHNKHKKVQGTVNEHKVWDEEESGEEEEEEPAPSGPLPSVGSTGHAEGTCRPCSYVSAKGGCRWGDQCGFCHFDHKRQKLSKKRRDHCQKFIEKQERQLEADPNALAEIESTLPSAVKLRPELKCKVMSRLENFAETVRQQQGEPELGANVRTGRRNVVAL